MPDREPATADLQGLKCPLPLRDYPEIILGHGGGGKLTAELVEHIFVPAFRNEFLEKMGDSTTLSLSSGQIAVSTDSYVVRPLFFPGGSIGDLAVNGTVNDLAMSGATPLYLTAGFILEEGMPVEQLIRIAQDLGRAARNAGVAIVAGDTKVVERGHGDGCYITTAGVGIHQTARPSGMSRVQPGDIVIVSGNIGDHGMAIMSVREGFEFDSPIRSDSAPLHELVARLMSACPSARVMRDPTRGGVATCLNEIAEASGCGIAIDEAAIPVNPSVQSACEFLGMDPLLVANEGKLLAVVPAAVADQALTALRSHPLGVGAAMIGTIVEDPHHLVVAKTAVGTNRIVMTPIGEQLPRIC